MIEKAKARDAAHREAMLNRGGGGGGGGGGFERPPPREEPAREPWPVRAPEPVRFVKVTFCFCFCWFLHSSYRDRGSRRGSSRNDSDLIW